MDFPVTEQPVWRKKREVMTTSLIEEISVYRARYEELPETVKEFCQKEFVMAMAVDCIYNLNIGELVGTQTKEGTEEVLKLLMEKHGDHELSQGGQQRAERETMNTYRAMTRLHVLREEMKDPDGYTGYLTVQQICDIHKVLLDGLHPEAGRIRKNEVCTHYDGVYFYPKPEVAEQLLFAAIDHHNIYMTNRPSHITPTEKDTAYVFKCAARLLFELVYAHPFCDGNGRMCRLLANYVISHITPFPVGLYHTQHPDRSGRDDYLRAILHCREHPQEGPQELASMLVEGAWQGWTCLFENLERRNQLKPGVTIGPIVVQKSKLDDIEERVSRACRIVEKKKGIQVDTKAAVEMVKGVTQEADVTALESYQFVKKTVMVDTTEVVLNIFN